MDAVIEAQPFGPRPLLVAPQKMGLNPGTLVLWGSGVLRYEAGWLRPIYPNLFHISDYQLYPHDFAPETIIFKKKTIKIEEVYGNDIHPATQSLDGNCAH